MSKRLLVFAKRADDQARQVKDALVTWVKKNGHDVIDASGKEDPILAKDVKGITAGVIIGGDGSFLRLVRRLEKKDLFPLAGINLGTLGFITEFGREGMTTLAEALLSGRFDEESRPLLRVELWRKSECIESAYVFNDAVLGRDARTSMLKLEVYLNQKLLSDVRADGYIVATPTGSTGYALSAGGSLIHPEVDAYLLIPICSHSLSMRPMVVARKSTVEILVKDFSGSAYLSYDGQIDLELRKGDRVSVHASDTCLRLVRSKTSDWAATLRAKLAMA